MRRLLALLLVLGVAAAAVWWFWIRPSTLLTCNRVAELCGTQVGDCRERLEDAEKAVGEDFSSRVARCVAGAKTCAEAVGCAAGAGTKELGRAGKNVFDGFKRALEK